MRIIAGKYKGSTIYAPAGMHTRPTSDKVRGAIFNILGDIEGARVLDLFAGSGALALEALSRGASEAVAVDNRMEAVSSIRRNQEKLQARSLRAVKADYRTFLRNAAKKGQPFDLIFIDPPYRMHRVIEPEIVKVLPALLSQGGKVIVESDSREEISLPGEPIRDKIYGDTRIRVFVFG